MVTNAARALTHESKYTGRPVSAPIQLYRIGLTDNPEEGRNERNYGMPVYVLHVLEVYNECVFHWDQDMWRKRRKKACDDDVFPLRVCSLRVAISGSVITHHP